MSTRKLRLAVNNTSPPPPPFPFNPEAQAAWKEALEAGEQANVGNEIAWVSVGAPGTIEKLRRATELLRQAAAIVQEIGECPEEDRRYTQHEGWIEAGGVDPDDVTPIRPGTLAAAPAHRPPSAAELRRDKYLDMVCEVQKFMVGMSFDGLTALVQAAKAIRER
jgi:hypothetical protein